MIAVISCRTDAWLKKDLFEVVQQLLKTDCRSASGKNTSHLYSGLLFCGDCGEQMTRRVNRYKGQEKIYFICSNYNKNKKCSRHSILQDDLDKLVLYGIKSRVELILDQMAVISKVRDYIELGSYLEQIFPFMGVRFISINDKYDSDQYSGNVADIDVNFKNLLYDLYSKDLSLKIKASVRAVKEQGKAVCSTPPFGYTKDPEDRHKFVIAEDEAMVVRRLFKMYADGMSTVEIARIFNEEGVKPPSQVWHEKGIRKAEPKGGAFVWQHSGMLRMLKNRAYVGDLVQGVTECKKIRDDRRVTDPEKWIISENHHEPIIDRETFDKAQERFQKSGRKWKRRDHPVPDPAAYHGTGRVG